MRDQAGHRIKLFVPLLLITTLTTGCMQLADVFQPTTPQGPGDAYPDYLGTDASTIVVEISHAPGALWDEDTPAEQHFVQEIERITNKNVEIVTNASIPAKGDDYIYSITELIDFHKQHQTVEATEDRVVMHALFLDGKLGGHIAGVAFAPHAFAIFKGSIQEATCPNDEPACYGIAQPDPETCTEEEDPLTACQPVRQGVEEWKLTRAVAIHEAGHLFGLVNCPLPMVEDREMTDDPRPETDDNPGLCHSENDESVMYWQVAVANDDILDLLEEGDVPWQFDEHDIQDARAFQSEQGSG